METLLSHAKRKKYEPQTYANLLAELTQLMEEVPKLRPDRDTWDIEGDWSSTGTIHFVDMIYQPLFDKIRSFDCRTIKLINYGKPAARLTFYKKHRYWLLKDKDISLAQKSEHIQLYINNMAIKALELESKLDSTEQYKRIELNSQIHSYRKEIKIWKDILDNLTKYEIAISNYSRLYFYITVNYKYLLQAGEYANEQEHLLNPQRDRVGRITQLRYNIIFIDPQEILREHPYQNREVEGFLNNFSTKTEIGRNTIYARQRPENDSILSFE